MISESNCINIVDVSKSVNIFDTSSYCSNINHSLARFSIIIVYKEEDSL